MKKLFFILACLFLSINGNQSKICIIIHGTWASGSDWHKPGGDFYNAIAQTAATMNMQLLPFSWTGKNRHSSRHDAGLKLATIIEQLPQDIDLTIIAHSHGANVVFIACQHLASVQSKKKIQTLYTLGAPISKKTYAPNMHIIHRIYHIFSFNDFVQPVLGFFERQFDEHERIANLRIFINGIEPGHSQLHDPLLGKWILSIHEELQKKNLGNFSQFSFIAPGIIYLHNSEIPMYLIDVNRNKLLYQDKIRMKKLFSRYNFMQPAIHHET